MQDADIAIIGAGMAGAALAWALSAHARVALLEREAQPGMHSTGRSAAMFIAGYGPPQVRALTRASRAFYVHAPPGFTETPVLAPRGVLYVATPSQRALLRQLADELAGAGCALKPLDAAQACARVPCLRAECVAGGLLEDDAMDIDVHALHGGYLRGLRRQGGALHCGHELVGAQRDGAAWALQFAGGASLRASAVVNAAGAWADAVAALFGAAPLGLQPRRRSAFRFSAPAGHTSAAWPCVVAADESWYFKPDAGQLLGSPANADDTFAHDVMPEELDIATGIARIEAMTTLAIRRPQSTWAGLRTFARDGEPVIGWDAACTGLFWLAAQGGYGIQSAAGAAALAAALLLGRPLPASCLDEGVHAPALSPARFS